MRRERRKDERRCQGLSHSLLSQSYLPALLTPKAEKKEKENRKINKKKVASARNELNQTKLADNRDIDRIFFYFVIFAPKTHTT